MRVAISGSTGLIGSALATHLEAQGHDVVRLRRGPREQPDALWQPDDDWVRPDALEGVDAVVHLAGASIGAGRWTARRREELLDSRVGSMRTLLDHIGSLPDEQRPTVFLSASAVGYYGERGDEPLTEESSPGEGFLAELVLAWEREAQRAAELGMRAVQTRFAPALTKDADPLRRLLLPFRLGVGGRLGSGRQWMPWVTLPDVVRAITFCLQGDFAGPVNVVAPGAVTNAEFTRALAGALHRPAVFPLPTFVLKVILGGQKATELIFSQRVSPARLSEAGFEFEHPEIDGGIAVALGREG